MGSVATRSVGDRRFFIDPSVIQKIVPYWTLDDAKECAKIAYGIVRERVINGNDRAYAVDDFISGAYEGIMLAKKRYEQGGNKLTVQQCRGYLRSYTAEEVKKKRRTTKLDVMHSGAKNLVYEQTEAVLEEIKDTDDDELREMIIDYIQSDYPDLFNFACAFFEQDGGRNALKKMFGKGYDKYRRQFIDAIEAFKDRSK
ncbi:MAG: hypothetical protein LBO72_01650 [Helicobacteraceae bacterium]|nr:hypothetical protein [Helicobacteraceae bacterium]